MRENLDIVNVCFSSRSTKRIFKPFARPAIILLISMIGAISLTFEKRENIKRQNYFKQIQREKSSSISLVDVESGKGVKLDE